MNNNITKKLIIAFTAVFFVVLALAGCSSKNKGESTATNITTVALPEITEIDAFVASVEELKSSYEKNELPAENVQDAFAQAMVVEGFIEERPELYSNGEYKTKVLQANTILQSIDINKAGLNKEDVDKNFESLKTIIERLSKKFN